MKKKKTNLNTVIVQYYDRCLKMVPKGAKCRIQSEVQATKVMPAHLKNALDITKLKRCPTLRDALVT